MEAMRKRNPKALYPTGFESAIVGIKGKRFILSREKILKVLMRDGMTREEAREYHDFNIEGAYMGKYTPIYRH